MGGPSAVLCALQLAHGWVSWEKGVVVGGTLLRVRAVFNPASGAQGLDFPDFHLCGGDLWGVSG